MVAGPCSAVSCTFFLEPRGFFLQFSVTATFHTSLRYLHLNVRSLTLHSHMSIFCHMSQILSHVHMVSHVPNFVTCPHVVTCPTSCHMFRPPQKRLEISAADEKTLAALVQGSREALASSIELFRAKHPVYSKVARAHPPSAHHA